MRKSALKPKRIFVSGASGFVGKRLCEIAHEKGYEVIGGSRQKIKGPKYQVIETGDLSNLAPDFEVQLRGIDVVIHLAARAHTSDSNLDNPLDIYRKINVEGTLRLARAAANAGVKRFVYLSSIKAVGEFSSKDPMPIGHEKPTDAYGISKIEAERQLQNLAEKSGLEIVILRPPLVYGPMVKANFLKLIKITELALPMPFAGAKTKRSYIYIDNLVELILLSSHHPKAAGRIYHVSDHPPISLTELIKKIASSLNKKARQFYIPINILIFLATIFGKKELTNKLFGSQEIDNSEICRDFNWSPAFSLEYGIDKTVQWYLSKEH